jgi:predicted dehydrogenase
MSSAPLTLAAVGCGSRVQTYTALAVAMPEHYRVVAAADPLPARLDRMRVITGNPDLPVFASDRDLFAAGKLADVLMIGTQDAYHVDPCIAALELGYDVLLEKPIATDFGEVQRLAAAAERLGRRVLICHVLRYTPFYTKIKALLEAGAVGEIVAVNATEGVGLFHQAHSFVRGHWAVTERASPMIIAKSCHDLDILSWLVDAPCEAVSSFGSLFHFTAARAPAGAPPRCTDGCPVAATCPYDAHRYLGDHRSWLRYVFDRHDTSTDEEIKAWLATSPWGRCVYHCDNTAVDRQVVSLRFANQVNATFTMTAFSEGREIEVRGTKGVLQAGESIKRLTGHDIALTAHETREVSYHDTDSEDGAYAGHWGGDTGLMRRLRLELRTPRPADMRSSLQRSVESHAIGFAAEAARVRGAVIKLDEFRHEHGA